MKANPSTLVRSVFQSLEDEGIQFVILRGFDDVFTFTDIREHDIDLLIAKEDSERLSCAMARFNLGSVTAVADARARYLYGAAPHVHFIDRALGIHFDCMVSLQYSSLDGRHIVRAPSQIESYMLARRCAVDSPWLYEPSPEDELMHLCCRLIFDKASVPHRYRVRIASLVPRCQAYLLEEGLEILFFRSASVVHNALLSGQLDRLRHVYLTSTGY